MLDTPFHRGAAEARRDHVARPGGGLVDLGRGQDGAGAQEQIPPVGDRPEGVTGGRGAGGDIGDGSPPATRASASGPAEAASSSTTTGTRRARPSAADMPESCDVTGPPPVRGPRSCSLSLLPTDGQTSSPSSRGPGVDVAAPG